MDRSTGGKKVGVTGGAARKGRRPGSTPTKKAKPAKASGESSRPARRAAKRTDRPTRGRNVFVLSRSALRAVDTLAHELFGIPTIVLMENASRSLAAGVLELAGERGVDRPLVLVVCGPGNNGGDGLGAARHLANHGCEVRIVLEHADAGHADDAATNLAIVRAMGIPTVTVNARDPEDAFRKALETGGRRRTPDVVVDALLGTGLDRPVTGLMASLIEAINRLKDDGALVVSADLPSGLQADTGEPLVVAQGQDGARTAVRADLTVTFAGLKRGFFERSAREFLGAVSVGDIGVPADLLRQLGEVVEEGSAYPGSRVGIRPGRAAGKGKRKGQRKGT